MTDVSSDRCLHRDAQEPPSSQGGRVSITSVLPKGMFVDHAPSDTALLYPIRYPAGVDDEVVPNYDSSAMHWKFNL